MLILAGCWMLMLFCAKGMLNVLLVE
jgi:hypothetical protein